MKVVVTGGTGFIGRPLVASFLDRGDEVTVLTRSKTGRLPAGVKAVTWPAGGPAASGEEGGIPP
ncbi:NAD-dependent epimerase/dehydratase family protein, partial [Desulforudis sp. 1190]